MGLPDKSQKVGKNRTFFSSVDFALQGFKTVFKEERNMKFHCIGAVIAIGAGFLFQLNWQEWLWILLVVFLVIAMEIINTIFENVVDMFTNYHFHPIGKKIKDMGAALVLFSAFFALVVGSIIFIPKIFAWISFLVH